MANLKELISKGTADSLSKLSDEELGMQQIYVFHRFMITTVQQAAINQEQNKRGFVENWEKIQELVKDIGEHIKNDDDLFGLKKEAI